MTQQSSALQAHLEHLFDESKPLTAADIRYWQETLLPVPTDSTQNDFLHHHVGIAVEELDQPSSVESADDLVEQVLNDAFETEKYLIIAAERHYNGADYFSDEEPMQALTQALHIDRDEAHHILDALYTKILHDNVIAPPESQRGIRKEFAQQRDAMVEKQDTMTWRPAVPGYTLSAN